MVTKVRDSANCQQSLEGWRQAGFCMLPFLVALASSAVARPGSPHRHLIAGTCSGELRIKRNFGSGFRRQRLKNRPTPYLAGTRRQVRTYGAYQCEPAARTSSPHVGFCLPVGGAITSTNFNIKSAASAALNRSTMRVFATWWWRPGDAVLF